MDAAASRPCHLAPMQAILQRKQLKCRNPVLWPNFPDSICEIYPDCEEAHCTARFAVTFGLGHLPIGAQPTDEKSRNTETFMATKTSMLRHAAALARRVHVGVAAALLAAAIAGGGRHRPCSRPRRRRWRNWLASRPCRMATPGSCSRRASLLSSAPMRSPAPTPMASPMRAAASWISPWRVGALELEWDNGKYLGVEPGHRQHSGRGLLHQGPHRDPGHERQSGWLAVRQVAAAGGSRAPRAPRPGSVFKSYPA